MQRLLFSFIGCLFAAFSFSQATWTDPAKITWTYDFGAGTGSGATSWTAGASISNDSSTGFLPKPPSGSARVFVGSNGTPSFHLVGSGAATSLNFQASSSGTAGKLSFYNAAGAGPLTTISTTIRIEDNTATDGDFKLGFGTWASNNIFSNNSAISNSSTTSTPEVFGALRFVVDDIDATKINIAYRVKPDGTSVPSYPSLPFQLTRGVNYNLEILLNNTASAQSYTYGTTNYTVPAGTYHVWANGVQLESSPAVYEFPKNELPAGSVINAVSVSGASSRGPGNVADNSYTMNMSKMSMELAMSPLPVSLVSFSGVLENNAVRLAWQTASEYNNSHFEILRSSAANLTPVKIGEVKGNGNSNTPVNYSFVDQNPFAGTSYYQLRQMDVDGRSEYSKVITIKTAGSTSFKVYQAGSANVKANITSEQAGAATLSLNDMNGRVLSNLTLEITKGENIISLYNKTLAPGIYVARIVFNEASVSQKILVQ